MATVALLIWPFIAIGLFAGLGPARGLIWACGIGFLFLPEYEAFDLPGLPGYGKVTVISLALVLGVLVSADKRLPKPEVTDKFIRFVMIALISGVFLGLLGTVMDNTNALVRAGRFQQGHSIRDLISLGAEILIAIVPFLLARRWLNDVQHHADLLFAFVILALVYSFLVLFELRMSPQLNRMVYDFFPHAWRQHVRGGGFRPIVFLSHGLSVGFFLFVATISAFVMARHMAGKSRILYALAGIWIFVVLLLSRNLGAAMLAAIFLPLILVVGRRALMWVAAGLVLIFMLYPVARAILPTDQFISSVASVSPDRAQSLAFRMKHEDVLLERAVEKPVFGWGGWGRGRIVDEKGRDQSVTDGFWIIRLGTYGWVGYLTFFGLIAVPVYFLKRRKDVSYATVGLAAILSGALIYSIPNAEINPMVWLMAGALAGFLQYGPSKSPSPAGALEQTPTGGTRQVAYSRFAPTPQASRTASYRRNL